MNGKEFVRDFDPEKPLIFLHIPKTAGISCRQIFEGWYGGNLLLHYFDEVTGSMPEVHDLSRGSVGGESVVVYGHFNRVRGLALKNTIRRSISSSRLSETLSIEQFPPTSICGKWRRITRINPICPAAASESISVD